MHTLKAPCARMPRAVWCDLWMPTPMSGGWELTRVTQPTAMKLGRPSTSVPTSTTGMGMKTLTPVIIFPIGAPFTCGLVAGSPYQKISEGAIGGSIPPDRIRTGPTTGGLGVRPETIFPVVFQVDR